MAKSVTITALDIGTGKVTCAIAELAKDGELEVVAKGIAPCRGMKNGALINSSDTVASVEEAINEAEKSGYQAGEVIIGLTSDFITSRLGRGRTAIAGSSREVTEADIDIAIENSTLVGLPSDMEIFKSIPRRFSVDGLGGVTHPVGMSGESLEAETYICAASSAYIRNMRRIIDSAGYDIHKDGMIPSAMASGLAVLADEERSLGQAVLDIGCGTSDLSIFSDGEIGFTEVCSFGGADLARALACKFNISESEAERLIIEDGAASPDFIDDGDKELEAKSLAGDVSITLRKRELAEVMERELSELLYWTAQKIFYARRDLGLNVPGIILTGGTAQLSGLDAMIKRDVELTATLRSPMFPHNLPEDMTSPIFSTVVGLLLYGAATSQFSAASAGRDTWARRWFLKLSGMLKKVGE